ncbi:TIGR00153 family protein [Saccharospirillum mangrovi]|uniref:TIGR00153 family protein n=1 Tax=Saccharospirillum mangrovi TaxID=2161747 RepID=UPI000D3C361E|nr:TIGR00153 family protein [Saccharospirillum mangrovi]
MAADSPLMALFGRSPVKPIQEHIKKAHACAERLLDFYDTAVTGDYTAAEAVRLDIARLEQEADQLKKDIRVHLPNSLFMPVPRSDLLELVTQQDRLANRAKDIAGIMVGREMAIPAPLQPLMREYLVAAIGASAKAAEALAELDELFETGFGSKEISLVSKLIDALDNQEHRTDELEITIRKALRAVELDHPPIEVMFLYRVIELIGDLADVAQRVGARLQILMAR